MMRWMFGVVLLCILSDLIVISGLRPVQKYVHLYDFTNQFIPYHKAYDLQEKLADFHIDMKTNIADSGSQLVGSAILLQHPSVYTLGTGTTEHSGPFSSFDKDGNPLTFDTIKVNRAGQATYHGPGQLVIYPILDLEYFNKDLHLYLRNLEEMVIHLCKTFYNLEAYRIPGYTGVWIEDHKIAAIGIKVRRWVTMHGLSLNVDPDLAYFHNIIPCGISDKPVGILKQFRSNINLSETKLQLIESFQQVFNVNCIKQDTLPSTF